MDYTFLLVIALILLSTKVLGLASEKVHMPQVVGALIAGLLLGPSVFNIVSETDFLMKASEIGVIILMFTAGLDTDLDELKQTGFASFIIALIGVIVPLVGGLGCYLLFDSNGGDPQNMLKAIFIGVVLTATSVSITVETLREMGKLKSKVGTAILGAAVIDDILGIIVLTVLTGFTDPDVQPLMVFGRIALFFVFLGIIGIIMHKAFSKMDSVWSKHRRIAIYALAFCFLLSFVAEHFFGIADITGAYFAGLILCNISDTREYAAKKLTVLSYMLFSPLFFASIGIKTELHGLTGMMVLFAVVLTLIAILSKVIGCGLGAKLMGFQTYDALSVGLGMVSRGEVALIVAQKGEQAGLIDPHFFPPIVLMVIVTTLITPVLLKFGMKRQTPANTEFVNGEAVRMPKTDHI
ncbi:cation:proton antiporter [Agathobaculum sp.]|uniref:cation:proton antiporter n=1 Tax=Agathobaculum sp. TaxID=2048138 RepID=UPI002A80C420|nr:cation:proton antiporter [Agathobaculum sp.]MDY3617770.1 cation:proton antiporter [Agathobaculum sp.]